MKAAPGLIPAVVLSVLGLAQMAGDLLGVLPLKGVAAATCASPAPKVFSAVRGFETYSTRFYLEWTDKSGAARSVPYSTSLRANGTPSGQRYNTSRSLGASSGPRR